MKDKKDNQYQKIYFFILFINCFLIGQISSSDKKISANATPIPSQSCGDYLTSPRGFIHTPNFPGPFTVPIKCRWVIDASNVLMSAQNHSVVIHLTQLYVYKGLTFTEYAYYESESTNFGATLILKITEGNIFVHRLLKTNRPYLVVEFELERLEGNHVRVLDHLLDVYGFNITYEITEDKAGDVESCSIQECSFAGNCYVSVDYRKFSCQCFDQFYGNKCQNGPLCDNDNANSICQNGGTCHHVGSAAVRCNCPPNFTGQHCEIPREDSEVISDHCQNNNDNDDACTLQCPVQPDTVNNKPCDCTDRSLTHNDRARYECRIKISNVLSSRSTPSTHNSPPSDLEMHLKKALIKYFRSTDKINAKDLKISNVSLSGEFTFYFYGASSEGDKIRDGLNRLVQRRRLDDLILEPTYFTFQQYPSLKLQKLSLKSYVSDREVRLHDQLILSCVALGSSEIQFVWYKDDMLINTTKSIKSLWGTREISYQSSITTDGAIITSILTIEKSTLLDKGRYTCQVLDSAVQQCKTVYVNVKDEPEVKIIPMSMTVEKGSNIQLTCITPNINSLSIGFSWTKNRALLKLEPGKQVWEDLYPAGSILKIIKIQKSAILTCNVAHHSTSVRVDVVNRTLIPICYTEKLWNLNWPDTAPGSEAFLECPQNFIGKKVSRWCTMENSTTAVWRTADFSECLYQPFMLPYTHFQLLTMGYQDLSNGSDTIKAFWKYLSYRKFPLLPGEGDRIINIFNKIRDYCKYTRQCNQLYSTTEPFILTVNRILEDKAIIQRSNILLMQRLIQRNLELWMSYLQVKKDSDRHENHLHLALSSMVLDIRPFRLLGYHLDDSDSEQNKQMFIFNTPLDEYIYPHWYGDIRVTVKIVKLDDNNNNSTLSGAVIVYRNMSQFFPSVYIDKAKDGTDYEYHLFSKIVKIVIFPTNEVLSSKLQVELAMSHAKYNRSTFTDLTCGFENKFSGSWDLHVCMTTSFDHPSTRCICPFDGHFALFVSTRAPKILNAARNEPSRLFVLLGCTCGLLQTSIAFFILCCYFWSNISWMNVVKIQFCLAVNCMMLLFIVATHLSPLSQLLSALTMIAINLKIIIFMGMSAPISQALLVYADLTQTQKNIKHFQCTVIAMTAGMSIICILTAELSQQTSGYQHESWWLIFGTAGTNIFISCVANMVILFIILYVCILRKARTLDHNAALKKKIIEKNLNLLLQSALILFVFVLVVVASIFHINSNQQIYHYIFASLSAFLGSIVLFIYATDREIIRGVAKTFRIYNWKTMIKKDSTQDSIKVCAKITTGFTNDKIMSIIPHANRKILRNPPISCNEPNVNASDVSKVAVTTSNTGASSCADSVNMRKYINPIVPKKLPVISTSQQGSSGCYIPEINDGAATNARNHSIDDINLETYNTSPRKYQEFNITNSFNNEAALPPYTNPEYYGPSRPYVVAPAEAPSPKVLCCSADIEPKINNTIAMPDITLATAATDTAQTSLNTVEVINRERANIIPDIASSIVTDCKKSDYYENPPSVNQPSDRNGSESEPNSSGMLDRISHDLDYLLNRTQQTRSTE